MPHHLQQRVRAYSTFAFSIVRFLTQVTVPTREVFRADQAAAAMTRSAMCSLGPGWLPALPLLGGRIRWPDVAVTAKATLVRAAAMHAAILDEVDLAVAEAGNRRSSCGLGAAPR